MNQQRSRRIIFSDFAGHVKTLQENLGHYFVTFTLDCYGHLTDTMRKASAERMQAFIENLQNV